VLPTAVLPVKESFRTPGWSVSAAPVSEPGPGTTLTAPSGRTSAESSAIRIAVSGLCAEGLRTQAFPAASPGPNFQAAPQVGKFHGTICPTTP